MTIKVLQTNNIAKYRSRPSSSYSFAALNGYHLIHRFKPLLYICCSPILSDAFYFLDNLFLNQSERLIFKGYMKGGEKQQECGKSDLFLRIVPTKDISFSNNYLLSLNSTIKFVFSDKISFFLYMDVYSRHNY